LFRGSTSDERALRLSRVELLEIFEGAGAGGGWRVSV